MNIRRSISYEKKKSDGKRMGGGEGTVVRFSAYLCILGLVFERSLKNWTNVEGGGG